MNQIDTDVVVIAGGVAGLAAAVTAAEGGARVIIFEKASTTGGTGNMGMGLFAVESRLQRLQQLSLTREEAFKIFMDYTHWRVDARLVRAYIDKSASTIDWLEKLGIEFFDPAAYFPGSNFTWHIVKPSGVDHPVWQVAGAMLKVLTDRTKELGGKIFLQTPAKKILKKGGRIVGVVAEDKSGETIQANAKAVIVATGGFGDNPEWIKKYTGYEWGRDLFSFRVPGLTGDGIRMAWEVGAAPTEMSMEMVGGLSGPFGGQGGSSMELAAFRQPSLIVNLLGERIINEEIVVNTAFMGNAAARQKNRCFFNIFDEATKKYFEEVGLDSVVGLMNTKASNLDASIKQALDQGCQELFVADSLEELCTKTGIDLNGLRETIDEYNKACDTGRDELFNKKPKYLRPVKQPKFYAGRFFPGGYGSLGGIKINYKTEVLTKDYEVIPGLYAAGTDTNTIYGDSYIFILPGNSMGFAVNSGRIAGENASEYIKRI